MCESLLAFHWNYICNSYRFWDIQRQSWGWRSFKVIGNGAVRSTVYDYLLVRHCIYSSIWYRLWAFWRHDCTSWCQ